MKIAVCIKQVPDTADIKWTENNTIQREGVESIINPFDMYALEMALRIKDRVKDCEITVLTMGPSQAEDMLRRAIAMGCDNAFLLSDKKFAAADTVATSRTLAAGIQKFVNDFDLIICGQFAVDGDTAQTGPSIAQHLNLPQVTYVKDIVETASDSIVLKKELEDGIELVKIKFPALICTLKCDFEPRRPLINGFANAQKVEIPVYSLDNLGIDVQLVGLKGSPTYVSKAFRPEPRFGGEVLELSADESANRLLEFINDGK